MDPWLNLGTKQKKKYQIDYIVPLNIYKNEVPKIESSIGTITNTGVNQ